MLISSPCSSLGGISYARFSSLREITWERPHYIARLHTRVRRYSMGAKVQVTRGGLPGRRGAGCIIGARIARQLQPERRLVRICAGYESRVDRAVRIISSAGARVSGCGVICIYRFGVVATLVEGFWGFDFVECLVAFKSCFLTI